MISTQRYYAGMPGVALPRYRTLPWGSSRTDGPSAYEALARANCGISLVGGDDGRAAAVGTGSPASREPLDSGRLMVGGGSALPAEDFSNAACQIDCLAITRRPPGLVSATSKFCDVSDRRTSVRRTPPTLKASSRTHLLHERQPARLLAYRQECRRQLR